MLAVSTRAWIARAFLAGGLFSARALGALVDGGFSGYTLGALVLEVGLTVLSVGLLRKEAGAG